MTTDLYALDLAYPSFRRPVRKAPPVENISVYTQVSRVLEEKRQLFDEVDTKTFEKRPVSLVGGDLASFGFLGLTAAKIIVPALKTIAVITVISAGFGLTAGLINLAIVLLVIIPVIAKAYQKGDMKTVIVMTIVAVVLSGLSLVMVTQAVYGLTGAGNILGKMGAYFAAHPGFLSSLIGCLTLTMVGDIVSKLRNKTGETLVARLDEILEEGDLRKRLERAQRLIREELALEKGRDIREQVIGKLSQLEKDIGVKAAMASFELFELVMQQTHRAALRVEIKDEEIGERMDSSISKVKELVSDWRRTLWIRALQQMLNIMAMAIGGATASVKNAQTATMINGVNTGILALGNGVAFYLDAFKPYGRNTPLVVASPQVDA